VTTDEVMAGLGQTNIDLNKVRGGAYAEQYKQAKALLQKEQGK